MADDREIYDRLRNIETTVARIDEREAILLPKSEDHEKRIHTLELKDAKRGGFITGIATLASAISAALTWLVNHVIGAN